MVWTLMWHTQNISCNLLVIVAHSCQQLPHSLRIQVNISLMRMLIAIGNSDGHETWHGDDPWYGLSCGILKILVATY